MLLLESRDHIGGMEITPVAIWHMEMSLMASYYNAYDMLIVDDLVQLHLHSSTVP